MDDKHFTISQPVDPLEAWAENRNGFVVLHKLIVHAYTNVIISGIGMRNVELRGLIGVSRNEFATVCEKYLSELGYKVIPPSQVTLENMSQATLDHLNMGYNILSGVISGLTLASSAAHITRSVELAEELEKTAAQIRKGLDEIQAGVKELIPD